jgi:hypothetical protein
MRNHVGESLTRPQSYCHCTPIALGRVGVRIECGCPPLAFRHALSLSPEVDSGEADMVASGEAEIPSSMRPTRD